MMVRHVLTPVKVFRLAHEWVERADKRAHGLGLVRLVEQRRARDTCGHRTGSKCQESLQSKIADNALR